LKLLFINQAFPPAIAATGQQLADLASSLAAEGHAVTVITSRRGFDNPRVKSADRETWNGVDVFRVWSSGFGRSSGWGRAIDSATFLGGCLLRLLRVPAVDLIVAMTNPPFTSVVGALFARWKRVRFIYWILDLHPDLALAAGLLRKESLIGRVLDAASRWSMRSADGIIVIDRFMKAKVLEKGVDAAAVEVATPWAQSEIVRYDANAARAFRVEQMIPPDAFVVMYAGNHSPHHPLDTILRSARIMPDVIFCFVGGGNEFSRVRRFVAETGLANTRCIPYVPLGKLSSVLSAADAHVVIQHEAYTGLLHPSKIYNILSVGVPIVYIGPPKSHIGEILSTTSAECWSFMLNNGDVDRFIRCVGELKLVGRTHASSEVTFAHQFSQEVLLPRMASLLTTPHDDRCGRRRTKTSG
jgi:colanic acid biosynthesis glycosyl transferase WcaI